MAYCVCAVYLHIVASLLAWTLLPMAVGMTPTLIVSGSMAPRINTGDVVLLRTATGSDLDRGDVITFVDGRERLVTHRIVRPNGDGTYTTRGDANTAADSTPVRPEQVRGTGALVIPAVGLPATWVRSGQWSLLVLWLVLSALAVSCLGTYGRVPPNRFGWSTRLDAEPEGVVAPPEPGTPSGWEPPLPVPTRVRWASATIVVALVLAAAGLAAPAAMASEGASAGGASNPDNRFLAATSFCTSPGSQTVIAGADAKVDQWTPTANYGGTADLVVDPRNGRVNRSLIHFTLPSRPAYCTMSATLRVYVSTAVANRTLEAWRAGDFWTEGGVTWNNHPAPAGTSVPVPSRSTAGWLEFVVTDHVSALYTGTNTGFLLKDSAEGSGNNLGQTLSSRTGTNAPELVLTFGAIPGRPAAPSSLAASAVSASKIGLAWVDSSTDETGFEVQRSLAGLKQWEAVASLPAGTTAFTDTSLASQTSYDYRVRAVNAVGPSAWSNVATATTENPPASPPAAPSQLLVAAAGVNNVSLSWTDNATDEDGFEVQRSPAGQESWSLAGQLPEDTTTFTNTGLTADTAYDFRVRATNNAGASAWSNVVTTSTTTCASVAAQTLISTADAIVAQGAPTSAYGALAPTTLGTRSANGANVRSTVRFAAPTIPLGCTVAKATLRLNVASHTSARTLQVFRADGAWEENTVTWNTQPAAAGTAATTTSALGWIQITVTDHVLAQLAGTNDGFVVRDSVENAGTTIDVSMSPKEGSFPPQLVVTFTAG